MDNPKLPPVKVKLESDVADATLQPKEQRRDAEPLSPTARFFLSDEFYTTVLCALEFKDRMEIDELRTILSDTLLKHPRFHSRMEHRGRCKGGEQVWVRTTVDMAYHVVEGTPPDGCDNNGDSSAGAARAEGAAREAESAEGGARPAAEETRGAKCDSACYEAGSMEWHMRRLQHQPPFDASRPLWRVHLVPLPNGRSAALFRIHHSMGDGVSLMSLLLACTRRTDNSALLPTLPTAKRQTGSQPSSAAAAAAVEVEESEELRKQLDDVGEPEKEQLKPGKVHMPSAASAFTLDSMTESPFAPDPVGQAAAEAAVPSERVTADAGGSVGAGGGGAMGKGAGAAGKRGGVGGLVGVGRWMWQVIAVLGNTLWHVSTFMAVLLWRADTATCVKMKSGSGGAQKKGGKGSSAVLQHPEEGRGEVQTGGGDAVGGDGSGDGGGGRFVFGVSGPMSLTDISRVRRAFGATINDVMVTVISGGLDRYLRHHHEQQAERAVEPTPVATSPLPTTVRLSAVCVVNIRPAPGLQISPLFPFLPLSSSPFQEISSMLAGRSKARWGNCLGTFLLPLPVHSPVLTNGLPTRNGSSDSKSSNGTQGVNGIPKSEQAAGEAEGMVQSKEGGAAGEVEQRRLRMVASMCASKRQSLEAHYNYVNARLVLATAGMKVSELCVTEVTFEAPQKAAHGGEHVCVQAAISGGSLQLCQCETRARYCRHEGSMHPDGRLLDQTTISFSNMMGPVEESACTLMGRLLDQTTLSFSNMMGPVEEVSLGGHAFERISPTVLGQPHALTLHFQTYNGAAHIVLSAIRENVPDPAFLMRCCEDAFAALQASVH
ncbi:unnamed protein product [Closterium sp. NIES-64]|nr:unnamed protein product [Closterium sp. NIES-64]